VASVDQPHDAIRRSAEGTLSFLNSSYAKVLAAVLVVQGGVFYAVAMRPERLPAVGPLSQFPPSFNGWNLYRESQIEPEIQEILKADDTLSRLYVKERSAAYLFIAFFKTQREGQSPHSPKNCLPGAGFEPIESFPIDIKVPDRGKPIHVNRYLTARGDEKTVTLYWYQSHDRIIAGEFAAKFWLIADSIRFHRSDCSLVRVVVQVNNDDTDGASKTAVEFAQAVFPSLTRQLPM
jgi:EpsI family protein